MEISAETLRKNGLGVCYMDRVKWLREATFVFVCDEHDEKSNVFVGELPIYMPLHVIQWRDPDSVT